MDRLGRRVLLPSQSMYEALTYLNFRKQELQRIYYCFGFYPLHYVAAHGMNRWKFSGEELLVVGLTKLLTGLDN